MQNNNSKLKTLNLVLLLLVFSFTFYAWPALAAVSGLTFTTAPRQVAPGASSEALTVSSGEAPGETGDLSLTSSSATGEFLNASGVEVSPTWNSNWANRTFYYRDNTVGVYTITATLTTRTSQQTWSTSQTIIIGSDSSGDGDDNGSNPDDDNTNTTSPTNTVQNNSGGNGPLSAHASPTPVDQVAPALPFKVGAGRPRLASVHSPIIFRAEATGDKPQSVHYEWTFGDGGVATGEQVNHIYYFPGEYQVVLNAVGGDGKVAISRTTVTVTQPLVTITAASPERVEIVNRSSREINLGGWRIVQGPTAFVFPADTIVTAGKNTIVPTAYLGFAPRADAPLSLTFPDAISVFALTPAPSQEVLATMAESLRQLSAKLVAIEASRRVAVVRPVTPVVVPSSADSQTIPSTTASLVIPPTSPSPVAAVATIPVPKAPSLFTRIKGWFNQ